MAGLLRTWKNWKTRKNREFFSQQPCNGHFKLLKYRLLRGNFAAVKTADLERELNLDISLIFLGHI